MSMTRKYYQELAEVIKGELATHRHNKDAYFAVRGLAYSLTDILARENPRFDRQKFYDAADLRHVS